MHRIAKGLVANYTTAGCRQAVSAINGTTGTGAVDTAATSGDELLGELVADEIQTIAQLNCSATPPMDQLRPVDDLLGQRLT